MQWEPRRRWTHHRYPYKRETRSCVGGYWSNNIYDAFRFDICKPEARYEDDTPRCWSESDNRGGTTVELEIGNFCISHAKMQRQGVIEPSYGPWSSSTVLVRKKDGSTRFCVDYRRLNDVTKKDCHPLPWIDTILDSLAGAQWFSTLDLKSGYWQVALEPADREKSAFCLDRGLWQFTVMPFGLWNAPAPFERLIERVMRGVVGCLYIWMTLLCIHQQ